MPANDTQDFVGKIEQGIAWAVMNRPESLNAFSFAMRDEMVRFFKQVEFNPEVRCVVLHGAGGNFMAGGDIKAFTSHMALPPNERRALFEEICHAMHPIIYSMRRLRQPVLASVAGACAGLGMSLVLASDLAIAADNAFFTLAYIKIGTTPDGGASFFLPRSVGLKRAMEIAMLSDRMDAQTVERYGIINRVVPAGELEAETRALARRLADGPPEALARTKQLLSGALSHTLEQHLQLEGLSFAACTLTDDMLEGVRAFLEKRRPKFSGR